MGCVCLFFSRSEATQLLKVSTKPDSFQKFVELLREPEQGVATLSEADEMDFSARDAHQIQSSSRCVLLHETEAGRCARCVSL